MEAERDHMKAGLAKAVMMQKKAEDAAWESRVGPDTRPFLSSPPKRFLPDTRPLLSSTQTPFCGMSWGCFQ